MPWTVDQVSSLAPDASALAAGKKTADPRAWTGLGQSAEALWGECKGSATYQVRVALADFASKCTCPSRKFPCKHALGLMFLAAQEPGRLPPAEPPSWVSEWLGKRTESAERKKERAEEAAAPPDPKAQAKRAEKRAERVLAGLEALELWMSDLVRTGLASVASRGEAPWQEQAARMVDAQAPGVAARLRQLAAIPRSAPDWGERVLDGLGRLALLTHAVRRLDALSPPLAADVRVAVGWTLEKDEVVSTGERVLDAWAVVGQGIEDDGRLRVQRTLLRGLGTGRDALVLQFAAGRAPFAETLLPGTAFQAELAFWPSASPLRALVNERQGEVRSIDRRPGGLSGTGALLDAYSAALARQPWLDRFPCALKDVVPVLEDAEAERWSLVDGAGLALSLAGRAHWRLHAIAGGGAVDLFGEWDGWALAPLGVFAEGRYHALAGGGMGA